jgi:hypothetical protein
MLALASIPLLVAPATASRRATVRAPRAVTTAWSRCAALRERAGLAGFSSWAMRPLGLQPAMGQQAWEAMALGWFRPSGSVFLFLFFTGLNKCQKIVQDYKIHRKL